MEIFKNIKNAKYHIERLKKEMPYIKNQMQLVNHVKLINSMIILVNDVEQMMNNNFKTDIIDRLILARFYSQIFPLYKPNVAIPIHQIVKNIDDDLKYPVEYQKDRIISFLTCKEVDMELLKDKPNLANVTNQKEWEVLLNKLLADFKINTKWN